MSRELVKAVLTMPDKTKVEVFWASGVVTVVSKTPKWFGIFNSHKGIRIKTDINIVDAQEVVMQIVKWAENLDTSETVLKLWSEEVIEAGHEYQTFNRTLLS